MSKSKKGKRRNNKFKPDGENTRNRNFGKDLAQDGERIFREEQDKERRGNK